ncbi:arginine N-succinyltransferase [Allohahella sp. A8]|uniref:arginine N-succinyltransferase n=1 Tax=Allohahella sp. A8 TaxID=3141461 RepID=UPI000C0BB184|nr:arginine N-succinyltransferase [Hahellaceae bacterium]|tara:strand:- start:45694 stop:46914 length:1221 start_codon:yes stop_codon:yes gene_type:complete
MLIRPIQMEDLDQMVELATAAGIGVTSLPSDRARLLQRIATSVDSFAGKRSHAEADYLFALQDTDADHMLGVCGVKASVGLDEVWYNYRVSQTVTASKEMHLHKRMQTLHLSNDMTGATEICSLLLHPDCRKSARRTPCGSFLSKCRFLFLAAYAEQFDSRVFAEMRGQSDDEGHSPFWEALGEHFFHFEFPQADYLSGTGNKAFIAELMPRHPIYTVFLNEAARDCISQVHRDTMPALRMLEAEGFRKNNMIDIFDGGPCVEAELASIDAVERTQAATLRELASIRPFLELPDTEPGETAVMVAPDPSALKALGLPFAMGDFRVRLSDLAMLDQLVTDTDNHGLQGALFDTLLTRELRSAAESAKIDWLDLPLLITRLKPVLNSQHGIQIDRNTHVEQIDDKPVS